MPWLELLRIYWTGFCCTVGLHIVVVQHDVLWLVQVSRQLSDASSTLAIGTVDSAMVRVCPEYSLLSQRKEVRHLATRRRNRTSDATSGLKTAADILCKGQCGCNEVDRCFCLQRYGLILCALTPPHTTRAASQFRVCILEAS